MNIGINRPKWVDTFINKLPPVGKKAKKAVKNQMRQSVLTSNEKMQLRLKNESFWGRYFTRRGEFHEADVVIKILKDCYQVEHLLEDLESKLIQGSINLEDLQAQIGSVGELLDKYKDRIDENIHLERVENEDLKAELEEKKTQESLLIEAYKTKQLDLLLRTDEHYQKYLQKYHTIENCLQGPFKATDLNKAVSLYHDMQRVKLEDKDIHILRPSLDRMCLQIKGKIDSKIKDFLVQKRFVRADEMLRGAYTERRDRQLLSHAQNISDYLEVRFAKLQLDPARYDRLDFEALNHVVRRNPKLRAKLQRMASYNKWSSRYEGSVRDNQEAQKIRLLGGVAMEIDQTLQAALAVRGDKRQRLLETLRLDLEAFKAVDLSKPELISIRDELVWEASVNVEETALSTELEHVKREGAPRFYEAFKAYDRMLTHIDKVTTKRWENNLRDRAKESLELIESAFNKTVTSQRMVKCAERLFGARSDSEFNALSSSKEDISKLLTYHMTFALALGREGETTVIDALMPVERLLATIKPELLEMLKRDRTFAHAYKRYGNLRKQGAIQDLQKFCELERDIKVAQHGLERIDDDFGRESYKKKIDELNIQRGELATKNNDWQMVFALVTSDKKVALPPPPPVMRAVPLQQDLPPPPNAIKKPPLPSKAAPPPLPLSQLPPPPPPPSLENVPVPPPPLRKNVPPRPRPGGESVPRPPISRGLLGEIEQGAKLRDANERELSPIQAEKDPLISTLAKAMNARRAALNEKAPASTDENDSDNEWD